VLTTRELARTARGVFAPRRVGRPGHGAGYWPLFAAAQLLRVHWSVRLTGRQALATGPAILVGNHLNAIDPAILGISLARRQVFIAKAEAYDGPAGIVLRSTGQIPLIRGDEPSTRWALAASAAVLSEGRVLCVYPEATRSPDGVSLHRLHRRVLLPLIESSPGVPIHAVSIGYSPARFRRTRVELRMSGPLPIDLATMTAEQVTCCVRDALLAIGGMPYVDRFGTAVKAARARQARDAESSAS
jgi:1-acyl-sn-glycerol-3-phosphate acyltransferase